MVSESPPNSFQWHQWLAPVAGLALPICPVLIAQGEGTKSTPQGLSLLFLFQEHRGHHLHPVSIRGVWG